MKLHDLFEAPIQNYRVLGNQDEPISHTKADLKSAGNPAFLKKVKEAWLKVPYDFNFFLVNTHEAKNRAKMDLTAFAEFFNEKDALTIKQLVGIFGKDIAQEVEKVHTKDSITVLWLHNEGDEAIPFTPWMLAHRLAHLLSIRSSDNFSGVTYALNHLFKDLTQEVQAEDPYGRYLFAEAPANDEQYAILKGLFSFGSVQNERLTRITELGPETFAQWLLTGKISINADYIDTLDISKKNKAMFKKRIKEITQNTEERYSKALKDIQGKIVGL